MLHAPQCGATGRSAEALSRFVNHRHATLLAMRMWRPLLPALLLLLPAGAAPQTIHLGLVEHWFLALAPLRQAQGCIPDDDALRPGLDTLYRDTHARAMRAIGNDFERGVLVGRLTAVTPPGSDADDQLCHRVLADVARGLFRLQLR
jgi:hypothetical protein